MSKYIPAEKLIAEIDRLQRTIGSNARKEK